MNNNGHWKLSSVSPALVASSGQVFIKERKPKGLTLEVVLGMIKAHPRKTYYAQITLRQVTLGEALSSSRFKDLGKYAEVFSSIDFNLQEHDREFESLPKTGEQLLKRKFRSKPLSTRDE